MHLPHTTIGAALREATALLTPTSTTPRLDAEVLLAFVLGCSRTRLLADARDQVADDRRAAFFALVERRAALEPVAYLVGQREFFGLEMIVDRRVLVPRPETEVLVELALGWARGRPGPLHIADLGTGSGCIAVALAVNLPQAKIFAVDISPDALAVAQLNVARHGVGSQLALLEGSGLDVLPEPIDLLVSNPPYTILDEIEPGVRLHEPHLALDGGPDGLDPYRWLFEQARDVLRPGGAVMVEIGADQGPAVADLARPAFPTATIATHPDLAGHKRVVTIFTPPFCDVNQ